MIRKALTLAIFLILAASLHAQYDEQAILYQNAQQLMSQRQYAAAEQAWLQLLQKYPNDTSAMTQLFQLYLQTSQPEKAQSVLNDYRTVLPANVRQEYEIQLDIQQAKVDEAWTKSQDYLQVNPANELVYRLLAGFFERKGFYEQAIRLYEQGRAALTNSFLFCLEIANNSFYSQQYEKAMTEYITYLEAQPGNLYFVGNQLNSILTENPDLISLLRTLAAKSSCLEVREVLAISLSRLGRLNEALEQYAQLPVEKLTAFANEQYTAGRDSVAIAAYAALRERGVNANTLGDILLKTAECHIRLRQFERAEQALAQIIDPPSLQPTQQFARKQQPYQALLMLSDLALWQGGKPEDVMKILNEAKKHTSHVDETIDIDFRIINTHFINRQDDLARQLLKRQGRIKQIDRQLYYNFLLAMAASQPGLADSLVNQLVLAAPASPYLNDIMTLNILLLNLQPASHSEFMNAYRSRLGHRDSLAVQTLLGLAESARDEELRVLAADWCKASGFRSWAAAIYNYEWQDPVLKEYASLQISKLQTDISRAESLAQDFLKSNPDSVFSPGFRQILQKIPTARPSF